MEFLLQQNWEVDVIVRCGKQGYTAEDFRRYLQGSALMVGFTVGSESQGIAWAEAWSTNVPTMILENTSNVYQGRRFKCSTAPYLCNENGLFFKDFLDFKNKFNYWEHHRNQFRPRLWTLEHMSDEVCAKLLLNKVDQC